jgi:hypothetical protein
MGWSNYIVIPSLKIAVETSRHVQDLLDWQEKTLDNILDNEDEGFDPSEVKLEDLNLEHLSILVDAYSQLGKLKTLQHKDELLIYWLKKSEMDYELVSEHSFEAKDYEKKGFKIIPLK